ncbi:MAG TPA: type II CAAX endopeptidase family protein [Longimicrobiales bacterium]|nr:type II CAAX endopeptidase family protein [Longimicrobiales bacterium]
MLNGRVSGGLARIALFVVLFMVLSILLAGVLAGAGISLEGRERLLATSIALLAAVVVGAALLHWLDDRSPAALGFPLNAAGAKELGLGTGIGVAGLAIAAVVLLALGKLAYGPDGGAAGTWVTIVAGDFALFLVAAASEEAMFRGYPFQVMAQRFGPAVATVVTSIAFAFAHGQNPNVTVFGLVNIFLAGVLLAIAYLKTLSLWFATGVHVGWNWAMASLFDLPVSGIPWFDTPLYEPVVGTPAWLTGGAFGPEAGLVGTIGFGLALLAVLRLRSVRIAESTSALRPLALANATPNGWNTADGGNITPATYDDRVESSTGEGGRTDG